MPYKCDLCCVIVITYMRNMEGLGDVFLGKEKVRKWLMLCLFVCVFVFKVAYFGVERMHSGARLPGSKSQTLSLKSCMIFSKTVFSFLFSKMEIKIQHVLIYI